MLSGISKYLKLFFVFITVSILSGCQLGPEPLVTPDEMATLKVMPIEGNTGEFMSPITSDGVPAEWVDNAINAKMGAGIGSAVGAYAGSKALEAIPFVGGFLGEKVGNAAGRAIAIEGAGGEEFIRESSDLSFNSLEDLTIYLYSSYGTNPNYQDVASAVAEIYTDLKTTQYQILNNASAQVRQNAQYTTNAQ